MSVYINSDTKVLIQGITGKSGSFHGQRMLDAGTNILAGTSPGKGGDWSFGGKVPVFDTVETAVEMTGVNTSVIFVPAQYAVGAIYEAVNAGIELIVCVSEGIPVWEMMRVRAYLKKTNSVLIGPGCAGLYTPAVGNIGVIPPGIVSSGNIGILSSSESMIFEVTNRLNEINLGVSSIVEIGQGPIFGANVKEILLQFENDPATDMIILMGEVGVSFEEFSDQFATTELSKPVFSYLSNRTFETSNFGGYSRLLLKGNSGSYDSILDIWQRAGFFPYSSLDELVRALSSNI